MNKPTTVHRPIEPDKKHFSTPRLKEYIFSSTNVDTNQWWSLQELINSGATHIGLLVDINYCWGESDQVRTNLYTISGFEFDQEGYDKALAKYKTDMTKYRKYLKDMKEYENSPEYKAKVLKEEQERLKREKKEKEREIKNLKKRLERLENEATN